MVVFSNIGMGAIDRLTGDRAFSGKKPGFSTDIARPHRSYFRKKTRLMRAGLFEKVGFPRYRTSSFTSINLVLWERRKQHRMF